MYIKRENSQITRNSEIKFNLILKCGSGGDACVYRLQCYMYMYLIVNHYQLNCTKNCYLEARELCSYTQVWQIALQMIDNKTLFPGYHVLKSCDYLHSSP